MQLEVLTIQALPGIRPGFSVEGFGPDVTVITGPNGVGKTSLVRALRYLLGGPAREDPPGLVLEARFRTGAGALTVRRTGNQVVWERDGQAVAPPPLPDRDELAAYRLGLEDLLEEGEAEEAFLTEVERRLYGGYDLAEAALPDPPAGRREREELKRAREALRQVEREYEALRRKEAELPRIEQALEAARRRAARKPRLAAALELLAVRRRLRRLEEELAAFPPHLEHLREEDAKKAVQLETERGRLAERERSEKERLATARERRRETGLEADAPGWDQLEAARNRLAEARAEAAELRRHEQERETARRNLERVLRELGAREPPHLSPEQIARARRLARKLEAVETDLHALRRLLAAPAEGADPVQEDRLREGEEALRAWLASLAGGGRRRLLLAGALLSLLAAGSALLAGVWLAGILALLAAAAAAFPALTDPAGAAKRRYEASGLAPPERWHPEAVQTRLEAIARERHALRDQALRAEERRRQEGRLRDLEAQKRALEEEKAGFGFDPALGACGFDRYVDLARQYDEARKALEAAEAAVAQSEARLQDLKSQVSGFLARWGCAPPGGDVAELEASLEELRGRMRRAEEALQHAKEAEGKLAHLAAERERLAQAERELYEKAGLAVGERSALEERCRLLSRYRNLQAKHQQAQGEERGLRTQVGEEPELLAWVEANDAEAIQRELAEAEEAAKERESLERERAEIRERLRQAGGEFRREEAAARVAQAEAQLAQVLHQVAAAEAGSLLLAEVREAYRSEQMPQICRTAQELFRTFTRQRYELRFSEGDRLAFRIRDREAEEDRALAELSTATRMHLLLAVRFAWIQHLERGREALPLFLDEALTNTDPERFQAAAQALATWARRNQRQVIYLSARPEDVELWAELTGKRPKTLDLAAIRFGRQGTPLVAVQPLPKVPPPEGHTPESYAQTLQVAPVDPRAPAGGMHLFHLLQDNLPLLHTLLAQWRVRSLGQLEGLLQSHAAEKAVQGTAWRERLQARTRIARAWVEAARRGRGRPVDGAALAASGLVSERFLGAVSALAADLGGDAARLVQALYAGEVRYFRRDATERLEAWLEEEGYLDRRPPLEREDRLRETLFAAGDKVPPGEVRTVVAWLERAAVL